MDFLDTAHLLRGYLRGNFDSESKQFAEHFAGHFPVYKWLAENQFQDYVQERMKDPYRIVGVYNLDFDKQEVSLVDAAQGWQSYQMRDVSTAVYAAYRRQWMETKERITRFQNHLKGKEITPSPEQTQLTQGSEPRYLPGGRTLRAEDISFAGNIVQSDNLIILHIKNGHFRFVMPGLFYNDP